MNCVRFVSINDDFDTVNGLTDQSHPHGARIRIPIKNAFNEQVAVEIKQKVEATLQMKIDRGTFVGPRAPFGYQKSEANHDQLVLTRLRPSQCGRFLSWRQTELA